jgi:hypothetical protein
MIPAVLLCAVIDLIGGPANDWAAELGPILVTEVPVGG